jgi:hypothetical protein
MLCLMIVAFWWVIGTMMLIKYVWPELERKQIPFFMITVGFMIGFPFYVAVTAMDSPEPEGERNYVIGSLKKAEEAVILGADPNAVLARLAEHGINVPQDTFEDY